MASTRTCLLLATAIVFTGLLVGGEFDRAIVATPAWRALGAEAWARYSRHADLGFGLAAYPVEGIGAAILALAALTSFHVDHAPSRAVVPLCLAGAFTVASLALTGKAAPIMLGLAGDLT